MASSAQELLKAADGMVPLTFQIYLQCLIPRQAGAVRHKYPSFQQTPRTEIQLVKNPKI